MKKGLECKVVIKISVLAAGLWVANAAYADNNVTLYGIMDAGVMYLSHSTPGFNGTETGTGRQFALTNGGYSPSLFGLKGSEDLGGGLKAIFKLESGISVANGGFDNPPANNGLFNRTAEVGLSSQYGTLKAGLQLSPFFLTIDDLDPRSVSQFGSMLTTTIDNSLIAATFMPNALSYTSPDIGGFEFAGLFGLGGVAGDFQNGRSWSLSAKYTNGTFLAAASYISVNNASDTGLAAIGGLYPANVRAYTAGASYKFGSVIVKGSFTNFKANSVPVSVNPALTNSTDTSVNVYSGGADWFVLPTLELNGAVYYQQDRVHSGDRSITVAAGTQYFLSKRTALYAQVAVVNNKCSASGQCLGSGLSVESGGSAIGGVEGLGTAAAGLGLPPGTTVGADVGIRVRF